MIGRTVKVLRMLCIWREVAATKSRQKPLQRSNQLLLVGSRVPCLDQMRRLSCRIRHALLTSIPMPMGWLDSVLVRTHTSRQHLQERNPPRCFFVLNLVPKKCTAEYTRNGTSLDKSSTGTASDMPVLLSASDVKSGCHLQKSAMSTTTGIIKNGPRRITFQTHVDDAWCVVKRCPRLRS
ncbi:hypothetical protein LY76DRAFT_252717 [Colletotrichum caudatum]|nr:hypothetical protein LY76DRAFT_252717 [Colletotrichum caudatum]